MSLADYQPEVRMFGQGKGQFSVAGLSLEHFALLLTTHLSDLEEIFDLIISGMSGQEIDLDSAKEIAVKFCAESPELVAHIVALAADGVDEKTGRVRADSLIAAAKLPLALQIDILVAVGELTFSEVGGVKKCLELLTGMLGKLTLKAPLNLV